MYFMRATRVFVGVRSELGRSKVVGGVFFFKKSYSVDTKLKKKSTREGAFL